MTLHHLAKHGAIGGVLAGLIFPMYEMAAAAILGMDPFMPLRMIGGIALGSQALEPGFSLPVAGAAAMVVHMALSIAYGLAFAVIIARLVTSGALMVAAGAVYGTLLWLVNFYVMANIFGWTWFPQGTDPVVQFIGHAGFFGVPLGLYLAWALGRRRDVRVAAG
jgi:hypothetical protein